jgi:hypothetical protein
MRVWNFRSTSIIFIQTLVYLGAGGAQAQRGLSRCAGGLMPVASATEMASSVISPPGVSGMENLLILLPNRPLRYGVTT